MSHPGFRSRATATSLAEASIPEQAAPRRRASSRANPDPELYARALAATGPAHEAIQNAGEAEFHRAAVEEAQGQLRDGLPLRAEINVVGYLARTPEGAAGA